MPGGASQQQQLLQQRHDQVRLKLERKRFMHSKAAVITGRSGQQPNQRRRSGGGLGSSAGGGGTPLGSGMGAEGDAAAADGGVSRAEFQKMQREVLLYGEPGFFAA
jgi:hypothetical protein